MATIDYKELYEQALAKAQELSFDGYLDAVAVNDIFPELKESEDERMRTMAIKAVYAPEAQSCIKSWGINPDDVIAWLEKQGKTSPILSNSSNNGKIEQNPAEVRTTGYWNVQDIEQNPAWSEEDEKMLNDILMCGEHHCYLDAGNIAWLKSIRHRSHWKPSDMELEVLKLAAEKDGTCLMGLYEQLKKLMEE